MITIACVNEKGGVGKTSTATSLAWALGERGLRVLVVDVDVQSHATEALQPEGCDPRHVSLMDLISEGEADPRAAIRPTRQPNVRQLVGSRKLANAEIELFQRHERPAEVLKSLLAEIEADYDYVLVDCPPSLNRLTMNAMVAAAVIVVPIDCSWYAYDSFKKILANTDSLRKKNVVATDQAIYVLYTLWNDRTRIAQDIADDLKTNYPQARAFSTKIPWVHAARVAPGYHQTVFEFPGREAKKLATAYRAVASELIASSAK